MIVFNGLVFAQAGEPDKEAAIPEETADIETNETAEETFHEEYVYHFPEIKPEFSGYIGYGFIDHNDSTRAGEFEYLHSSIIAGGKFIAFPFPHRLHLEFDFLNKKDYFGDLRYAYKDLLLFRGLGRSIFHNLDNRILTEFGTSYAVTPLDSGEKYGITKSLNNLFLRFKTPNFPFHVYISGNFIDKEGTQQQRFLANYSSDVNRTSQKREVDWNSRDIIAGVNSHIGPVEMDISHSEKRLTANGDRILENNYGGSILPNNLLPETKGSATTLKLHTSYTGRLVASATFSWMDRKNEESKAKADYFIGAGDITYMLNEGLTFFAKYRHKEKDRAQVYAVNLNYMPEKKINLNADVSYTESKGNFSPGRILAGVTSLSDSEVNAKIKETSYTIKGDYEFIKGWGLGVKYNYVNYNDQLNNSNDESLHAVLLMISQKWQP